MCFVLITLCPQQYLCRRFRLEVLSFSQISESISYQNYLNSDYIKVCGCKRILKFVAAYRTITELIVKWIRIKLQRIFFVWVDSNYFSWSAHSNFSRTCPVSKSNRLSIERAKACLTGSTFIRCITAYARFCFIISAAIKKALVYTVYFTLSARTVILWPNCFSQTIVK